jgi:hypothetical protein
LPDTSGQRPAATTKNRELVLLPGDVRLSIGGLARKGEPRTPRNFPSPRAAPTLHGRGVVSRETAPRPCFSHRSRPSPTRSHRRPHSSFRGNTLTSSGRSPFAARSLPSTAGSQHKHAHPAGQRAPGGRSVPRLRTSTTPSSLAVPDREERLVRPVPLPLPSGENLPPDPHPTERGFDRVPGLDTGGTETGASRPVENTTRHRPGSTPPRFPGQPLSRDGPLAPAPGDTPPLTTPGGAAFHGKRPPPGVAATDPARG